MIVITQRWLFFTTQPQCYSTFPWTELQMLLRCCLKLIGIMHHYTETLFIFTISDLLISNCIYLIISMWCIYVISYLCDLSFIFIFISIKINWIISWIHTNLSFCLFFSMSYYFSLITWLKNLNNFQMSKVQPHSVDFLSNSTWRC